MSKFDKKKLFKAFEQYQRNYPYPARIEHYAREARKYLKLNKSTIDPNSLHPCQLVLIHSKEAMLAAQRGDFDHFAQAFERVERESVNLQLPKFEAALTTARSSKAGKSSKRRPGPLRTVLQEICKELDTLDSDSILTYWALYDDPTDAEFDTCSDRFVLNVDNQTGELEYWFTFEGRAYKPTRKQIQDALSRIRTKNI